MNKTKIVAIFIVILVIESWLSPSKSDLRPGYEADPNVEVVLYATSWCGYCEEARELFNDHGISYYEYDIEESEEGYKQHKKLGWSGVPVILINGKVFKGFNQDKKDRILDIAEKI